MFLIAENKPPSNKSPLDFSVLVQTDSFQQQNHIISNKNRRHTIKEVEARKIFHNIFFFIIYRLILSTACNLSDAVLFLITYNIYVQCASIGLQALFALNIIIGFLRQFSNSSTGKNAKNIASLNIPAATILDQSSKFSKDSAEKTNNIQKNKLSISSNNQLQLRSSLLASNAAGLKSMVSFDPTPTDFHKDIVNTKFKRTIKPSSKFLYNMNSLSQE